MRDLHAAPEARFVWQLPKNADTVLALDVGGDSTQGVRGFLGHHGVRMPKPLGFGLARLTKGTVERPDSQRSWRDGPHEGVCDCSRRQIRADAAEVADDVLEASPSGL